MPTGWIRCASRILQRPYRLSKEPSGLSTRSPTKWLLSRGFVLYFFPDGYIYFLGGEKHDCAGLYQTAGVDCSGRCRNTDIVRGVDNQEGVRPSESKIERFHFAPDTLDRRSC